ncbi:MAG: NAD-dependent epimerase/dehydratase family protein, partial [Chitinophagaceae bacterium]
KEVLLWGTGSPLREFLYADDMADAIVFCMLNYNDYGHINVGSGQELTIKTLAEKIKNIVGYYGRVIWDTTKPDGTPRKLMDSSKLYAMGWSSKISLEQGIKMVYDEFISSYSKLAYN